MTINPITIRAALLLALLHFFCACTPAPGGSMEPETMTRENAPARVVTRWRASVGDVSDECAARLSRTVLEWIPQTSVVAVCGKPAGGCTLEPGTDGPAVVALVDGASYGDFAHELVHVLSACELGAYDSNHRNRAAWAVALELGGNEK